MTWTLRKKILLGYGIALLLLAVVFVLSFVNLQRLGRASEAILSENYRSILAAEHMVNALERQDSGVLLYLLGDREQGVRQFRENQADFQQWLGRAKDNIRIEEEPAVLARIDSTYADYLVAFTALVQGAPPSLAPSAPRERYREQLLPGFRPVRDASQELRELNQETMFAASRRAQDVAHRATWTLGIVGSGVLMVGLLFSLLLSYRIVRPVRELSDATRRIADGDYEVEVPADPALWQVLGPVVRAPDDVERLLRSAGLQRARWVEILTELPHELEAPEETRGGKGDGLYAVVEAVTSGCVRERGVEGTAETGVDKERAKSSECSTFGHYKVFPGASDRTVRAPGLPLNPYSGDNLRTSSLVYSPDHQRHA